MKSGTEHDRNNAHIGEKSDEFGSATDELHSGGNKPAA
jgi:hypothetical protein